MAAVVAQRFASGPSSPAINFFVPGLEGVEFCAYGSDDGSVVVGCTQASMADGGSAVLRSVPGSRE
jgi:hypothetical protein